MLTKKQDSREILILRKFRHFHCGKTRKNQLKKVKKMQKTA